MPPDLLVANTEEDKSQDRGGGKTKERKYEQRMTETPAFQ